MKRLLLPAAIVLCLAMLTGCGVQETLHEVAVSLADTPTDADAGDESYEPEADGEYPAVDLTEAENSADAVSDSDANPEEIEYVPDELPAEEHTADFTALSLSECVADADGTEGQLPVIILDCPGADSINEDIEGTFRYLVGEDYCTMYYEACKNGSVLSVVIAQLYDGDASYFTPYLLDLASGERMSGGELLDLLGLSANEVREAETRIMADEFEYEFGGLRDGDSAAFYQEQYEHTVSEENTDTNRLWLDSEGELSFVAKIFSMAGPEYFEYPMGTGYYY